MLYDSASLRVIDALNGVPLFAMRFLTVVAALDYLEHSAPKCADCGSRVESASIHSVGNGKGPWQVRFPHDCNAQSSLS